MAKTKLFFFSHRVGDRSFVFVRLRARLHLGASLRIPLCGRRVDGGACAPRLPRGREHSAELLQRNGLALESDSDLDLPPDQGDGFLRNVFPHL